MKNWGSARISGNVTEFNLKEDYFSAWMERFEFYIILNEINSLKMKFMFLTLLGNKGYVFIRDLCSPS